jgi:hypothetical protein
MRKGQLNAFRDPPIHCAADGPVSNLKLDMVCNESPQVAVTCLGFEFVIMISSLEGAFELPIVKGREIGTAGVLDDLRDPVLTDRKKGQRSEAEGYGRADSGRPFRSSSVAGFHQIYKDNASL